MEDNTGHDLLSSSSYAMARPSRSIVFQVGPHKHVCDSHIGFAWIPLAMVRGIGTRVRNSFYPLFRHYFLYYYISLLFWENELVVLVQSYFCDIACGSWAIQDLCDPTRRISALQF